MVRTLALPASPERFCAWFGDRSGDLLWFGISAFWANLRAADGDPRADLETPGPARIGRFDLASERHLAPITVSASEPGGVWDVLVLPDGSLFFTTYFTAAGIVAPDGAVRRLPELGLGLNEISEGPDGRILVTRYGYAPDEWGSVLVLEPDGQLVAEHRLSARPGLLVAAKSVAWDPLRREIWVNTDLIGSDGSSLGHDTRILREDGSERLRFERPEVQFMAFADDGRAAFAEADGTRLVLRIREPDAAPSPLPAGRIVPLDPEFPAALDFVQEVAFAPDGRILVTRWSGRVDVVDPAPGAPIRRVDLERPDGALFYTSALRDGRVCATACDEVSVVCASLLDGDGDGNGDRDAAPPPER